MPAQHPMRLPAALAASAALHAAALALVLRAVTSGAPPAEPPPAKLITVSLISRPGGGGGGPIPGPPSAPKGPPDLPVVAMPAPKPLPVSPPPADIQTPAAPVATPSLSAVAKLRALAPQPSPIRAAPRHSVPPRDAPAAVATVPSPSGESEGQVASLGGSGPGRRAGGGIGTGDGSGGDGSDALARPAYGANPKPPYPLAARRLGVEGVVTLEVVVRSDGTPAEVQVRASSGSSLLDDSARDTVRSRWRFVPARRGDVPVESRVTFPIRFKLDAS